MHVHAEASELSPIQRLLHRTVFGRPLRYAIAELRDRFPEASLEVAALEVALADAAHELEAALDAKTSKEDTNPREEDGGISDG